MNRGAKTISNSLRPVIDRIKSRIMDSKGFFDADGYVGKTAIKELREFGYNIKYYSDIGSYKVISR